MRHFLFRPRTRTGSLGANALHTCMQVRNLNYFISSCLSRNGTGESPDDVARVRRIGSGISGTDPHDARNASGRGRQLDSPLAPKAYGRRRLPWSTFRTPAVWPTPPSLRGRVGGFWIESPRSGPVEEEDADLDEQRRQHDVVAVAHDCLLKPRSPGVRGGGASAKL